MKEINIGMLVNTHGLRGEMKVKVLTDFPQLRFQKGAVVHLQLAQGQFDLKVQHVRESKGQLLVKFEGYDDINQVEGWKGSMLTIREESCRSWMNLKRTFTNYRMPWSMIWRVYNWGQLAKS